MSFSPTDESCPQAEIHSQLLASFQKDSESVRTSPGNPHALIHLRGRDWNEIKKNFNRRTRTALRKASENGLVVRELHSDEELRQAHGAWLASATRKGFAEIRPWKAIHPVLRYCIDHSLGCVIASYSEAEMLASIFFTCFGDFGRCIYAGHYDEARSLFGNHILQVRAMQICMERGFDGYDLDVISLSHDTEPDGVDQYKLGFGATPTPASGRIVWERKPALCKVVNSLHELTLVQRGLRMVRRKLMREGG